MSRPRQGVSHLDPLLRRYLTVNFLCLLLSTAVLAVAWAAGFNHSAVPWDLLIMGSACVAHSLVFPISRVYGNAGSVVVLLVTTTAAAFALTWFTAFLGPMTVLLPLIPLLVATPYLGKLGIRIVTGVAVWSMAGVAVISEWRREGDESAYLSASLPTLALAVPSVAIVIAMAVIQNYRRLDEQARDLRASRRNVVAVADASRRSLERDLHDGAQQRLVGISVRLGQLRGQCSQSCPPGPATESIEQALEQLTHETAAAIAELRELARGLHPPLLRERGLVAALQEVSRRSTMLCTVYPDRIGRYDSEVETAVYYCVLESLQNATKHSGADEVIVRLWGHPRLRFEVTDQGCGFDVSSAPVEGGLLGMKARIEAAGGTLSVTSRPGEGTRVYGELSSARPT